MSDLTCKRIQADAGMADSEELTSLHRELAKEAWKRSDDSIASSDAHTIQFGLMALRSPLIVLSASIVALLSFVSANSDRLSGTAVEVGWIFTWLVAGLVLGGAGPAAAYFTQYFYTMDLADHERTFDHPYLKYPKNRN
ncbi:hypothetical protein [Amorphus sp. 3PC139-8]|uniref:hypothetical protein n=1 Tax=Amorphus sp. 3PC139-8 TaxID=2735676 RepID=UPI00345C6D87